MITKWQLLKQVLLPARKRRDLVDRTEMVRLMVPLHPALIPPDAYQLPGVREAATGLIVDLTGALPSQPDALAEALAGPVYNAVYTLVAVSNSMGDDAARPLRNRPFTITVARGKVSVAVDVPRPRREP